MKEIQLTSVPRLSLSTLIGKVFYEVSIKECNGIMAATVIRDGVTIVDNRRCCAGVPIIPRGHLEDGNFFILTGDDEIPYFTRFDGKEQLVYLSRGEIDEIANSFSPWPEVGSIPSSQLVDFDAEYGELGGIALSRSSSATYIDKLGVLRTAAVDEPRFEKEGLLIEGASTNLVRRSSIGPGWLTNGSACSIDYTDPFYTKLSFTDKGGSGRFLYVSDLTIGNVYTISFWAYSESVEGRKCSIGIEGAPSGGGMVRSLTTTPTRYVQQFTTTGTSRVITVYGTDASDWGDPIYVGGFQVEALPFATSYIPTSGAAATRADDKASVKDSSGYQPVSVYRKFLKKGVVTKELVKSSDLLPAGFYGHLQELKAWHRLLTDEEQAALGVRYV